MTVAEPARTPTRRKAADPVLAYTEDVISGRAPSCKWVRLACERHVRDLKDPRFRWDLAEALLRIEWFKTLRHYKGQFKGRPFILEPWQQFIIGSVFGWKLRQSGHRRYRTAFVKVPRKNGKTFLAAGVAIQMLLGGGQLGPDGRFAPEPGAEVYFVATKEDQAKIGWNDCRRIVKRSPGYADRIDTRVKELRYEKEDGVCRPLGADSDSLDGLNPSAAIKDELHAWTDRNLWDVIEDAFGARDQPIDFAITTEGTLREGIHDEIDQHAKNVLQGGSDYVDDSFFAMIFTLDEGDDPFEERHWPKANPNLGISKGLEYMRQQASRARQMPAKLSTFLTKQLDVRTDVEDSWLALDQWNAGKDSGFDWRRLAGATCFPALDLGRVHDFSSLCMLFPLDGGRYAATWRYWLPESEYEKIRQTRLLPIEAWRKADLITVTDGNVTDFGTIEHEIVELSRTHPMRDLGYDPMFAHDLAMRLKDNHGLPIYEFRQTYSNYTPACNELDRLLASSRLIHDGNAVARWNAGNVTLRRGPSGNMMPDKMKSKNRIDGISALLMALARAMTAGTGAAPPGFAFV